jgi:hypothetical protein
MANDYLVKERSNDECRRLAKKTRTWFGRDDAQYLDVCECLTKGEIWTVFGVRRLVLTIKPDEKMGEDDAVTTYADGVITITTKRSRWDRAQRKHGRSRQTLAHELGHAVQGHAEMRTDAPMAGDRALRENTSRQRTAHPRTDRRKDCRRRNRRSIRRKSSRLPFL